MAHIPFLIVVVCEMDVTIGTSAPVVAVCHGDDTTNGEAAMNVGVRAILKGMSGGPAVGAVWGRMVRKREGASEGVMVPRAFSFIDTSSCVNYDSLAEGHGGVLVDLCVSSYVAGRFGDGKLTLQIGMYTSAGLRRYQVFPYGCDGVAPAV